MDKCIFAAVCVCRSKQPDKLWCYHTSTRVWGLRTRQAILKTICLRLLGGRVRAQARVLWVTYFMCETLPVSMILMKTLMMTLTSEAKYAIMQSLHTSFSNSVLRLILHKDICAQFYCISHMD